MSLNSALTSGQLEALRGTSLINPRWFGQQYISLCNNTTIFAARVNQASFTASFAQITFDTVTTGAYTDIQVGETVYLSHTNDIRAAYFRGRVRKTPTSSILYLNETSVDVQDNDYIFVVYDFAVWDKLAREVSNVQFKDYDVSFRQIPPVVYGLQSAYVGVVSGSPTGFTVAFAAQAYAGTSGATISSYAYTIPSGGTVTAGAANTANVTVRFDAGEYWVRLVVTDSGSRTTTRYIFIKSVPADFSAQVALGFTGASISRDLATGHNATIEAFDGISNVYDNTLAVVWTIQHYNNTETSITGNIDFIGRLRTETDAGQTDETYSYLQTTSFELEGVGSQLARLTAPLLALRYDGSPAEWDEITNLTIWRAIIYVLHEHSTFLSLHDLTFDSVANTFLSKILNTQGSNLLAVIQDLIQSINGSFEFSATGQAQVIRDLSYESTANRNAATTVAPFETQDFVDLRLTIDHIETIGRVEASGGTFNSTSDNVTPLLAIAPGVAQSSGEGRVTFARQILQANVSQAVAQTELNARTGHHYAKSNPTDVLTTIHPDGYNFLTPSLGQWYTWTIPTSTNLRGRAYTTANRWLLIQVTVSHDNETGSRQTEATYALETFGNPGQTVTYPAPAEITPVTPSIPPFDPYTSFPDLPDIYLPPNPGVGDTPPYSGPSPFTPPKPAATDGNAVMIWDEDSLFITPNYIASGKPTWLDVTPDSIEELVAACFDVQGTGAYLLARSSTTWSHTFNYVSSNGSWVASPSGRAAYTGGVGWVHGTPFVDVVQILSPSFASTRVTSVTMTISTPMNGADKDMQLRFPDVNGADGVYDDFMGTATTKTISIPGGVQSTGLWVGAASDNSTTGVATWGGAITSITVNGTGVNPFSGNSYSLYYTDNIFKVSPVWTEGDALTGSYGLLRLTSTLEALYLYSPAGLVRYSTDRGVSWSSAISVGASPGSIGGGDVVRIGTTSLFGANNQVKRATTGGGAYSDYGGAMPTATDPACIVVPRYQFGSASASNNSSTPQYLVASNDLSAADEALWKVTASGVTFTDITPQISADYGRAPTANCLAMPWWSGSRIAAIMLFNTTRHLVTSSNAGGAWSDRGALTSSANFLKFRKGDKTMKQLFGVGKTSASKPFYSGDFGATIVEKASPTTGTLLGIDVYG